MKTEARISIARNITSLSRYSSENEPMNSSPMIKPAMSEAELLSPWERSCRMFRVGSVRAHQERVALVCYLVGEFVRECRRKPQFYCFPFAVSVHSILPI